ncbi:MAG: protein kinase, partial [Deltaproteobacteria bacterium]|nr:protein kinase [Deltaproteobacteria bacterium]
MEGFRARPGEVLGERYRLVRRLGEGGMGEVWEAVHLVLKRHVAVKILKPRFAQQGEVLLRFRREAQVTAGLGHSKIVEVLDFVWGPGKPTYLVMELLQGQSLESALAQRGCLAWPVALKIAVDVLDALGAAHAAGIVHRDVKPANIWLEGDLNEPRVKVLDFGVAQIADEGGPKLTQTNATVGTPQYLPPEQIAGSRVDARADLWALGVTLFETLAGRPPFVGGDFAALVGAILTQEPPHLRALVPEVPATLANAVAAVLSKSPEQRPASAQAMATPLLELLATVTRKRGDEAFAATMALSSPVVESPGPELPPAAVPALDSSPRLPGTRVHSASSAAAARPAKKHRFSHAMVLNADDALPAQLLAQGPTDAALLELDDDEPPVLPTLSTGRWLLGGLVFALVGAVVLFAILGRQSAPPDSVPGEARAESMDAGVTGSASRGPAPEPVTPASAGSRDAEAVGSAPPAAPSTESPAEESPRAQDAGSPSTRVLPPQAP